MKKCETVKSETKKYELRLFFFLIPTKFVRTLSLFSWILGLQCGYLYGKNKWGNSRRDDFWFIKRVD